MTLYGIQWLSYSHVKPDTDASTFKKRFERFEGDEYSHSYSANPQGEIVVGPNVQQHLGLFKTKEEALAAAEYDHTHWVDEFECPPFVHSGSGECATRPLCYRVPAR